MHNIKDIRQNPNLYKEKLLERNYDLDLDGLIKFDKKNRELITKKESLEQEKKKISKNKDSKNFELSKKISKDISIIDQEQKEIQKKIKIILETIPNIALDDVPKGQNEKGNKIIKEEGNKKKFDFKIKSHIDLGEKDRNLDFETSVKLSGSRFVVLQDKYALLERALINFMLDLHTTKFGYKEISPPLIVNEEVMYGTGQLPKFKEDQFELNIEDGSVKKYLIPTAEVVLTNLVRDSFVKKEDLPLRYVASTPCFRKEAGSYGKDTIGLMRQHQFYKVELVSIVEPERSNKELDRMLNCAEEVLKLLELPYRVVLLCTGDMGFSAEKTYDIEVWIPFEKQYREISSCSSCGTFQAKRMMAKYKEGNNKNFLSTLNGSGLAVGRLMIALVENYQNSDGKVIIPNVLKKYMNNLDKI